MLTWWRQGETMVASGENNKGGSLTGACRGSTGARRLKSCVGDSGKMASV